MSGDPKCKASASMDVCERLEQTVNSGFRTIGEQLQQIENQIRAQNRRLEKLRQNVSEVEVAHEADSLDEVGSSTCTNGPTQQEMENILYGSKWLASSFFFGYLHIVLPQSEYCSTKSFEERLDDFSDTHSTENHQVEFPVKKMLIVFPRSCFIPPEFKEQDRMEAIQPLEVEMRNRAGVKERTYRSTVYKLFPKPGSILGNRPVYAVVEGATPIMTIYNTYERSEGSALFPMHHKKLLANNLFKALQDLIKRDPRCRDLCELIQYDDEEEDKVSVADVVLTRMEEIKYAEQCRSGNQ